MHNQVVLLNSITISGVAKTGVFLEQNQVVMPLLPYCFRCCKIRWYQNCTKSGGFLVYVLQYQVVALLGAFLLLCCTSVWFSAIVLHFQVVIFGRHHLEVQQFS